MTFLVIILKSWPIRAFYVLIQPMHSNTIAMVFECLDNSFHILLENYKITILNNHLKIEFCCQIQDQDRDPEQDRYQDQDHDQY